jgi:hypothetical protein
MENELVGLTRTMNGKFLTIYEEASHAEPFFALCNDWNHCDDRRTGCSEDHSSLL